MGSVELSVTLGGHHAPATFYVVDRLSQDVILGVEFMQNNGAVLDYTNKRLSLRNGVVSIPLLTSIDSAKAIRTVKRVRIPANHEVILPVRLPNLPRSTLGITETLPSTLERGVKVASALVDCANNLSLCRVANPTERPLFWPAGHAFAYLNTLPPDGVGVNLIDVSECFNVDINAENDKQTPPDTTSTATDTRGGNDDENTGSQDRRMPPHEERLSILHGLGVKIGTDVLNAEQAEKLSQILYESQDIMAHNYMQVPEARVPRHTIPLIDERPSIQKRFRYDPIKEQKLEDLCDELLEAGIITESKSLWCSPVFLVTKPDGSSRFLVDFRAVNAKIKPLFCALPNLEDIFDQISEEQPTIFSVLDLRAGYYSIGLDEASQPYTAFSTKNRHFQFARLPMGYVNSGSVFTQSLYKIFAAEVRRHMIIYVDDVIIMNRRPEEHIEFLRKIFNKFREYNIRLHPKKMNIATSSANFLGYTLHQGGYTVDTGRCKIIKEYPRPRNAKEIKRFLGIASYFRRLIKNYSQRSAPLRELMAKNREFEWTERQEQSFRDIRDTLCTSPVLGYPDRNKPLRVILDACATGLGYILAHVNEDGTETPLFYGGRSTTRAERNYCATELELAALLAAVKTYWSYLANTEFEIVTDHVTLTYIKNLRFGPSKLVRASLLLNQFKFRISHIGGRQNSACDAISRTIDLQTDPLTAHEANRFQADSAMDLRLDYATAEDNADEDTKTYRDVGIQCDIADRERCDAVRSADRTDDAARLSMTDDGPPLAQASQLPQDETARQDVNTRQAVTTGPVSPTDEPAAKAADTASEDDSSRSIANDYSEASTNPVNPIYVHPDSVNSVSVIEKHRTNPDGSHNDQVNDMDSGQTPTSADDHEINLETQRTDPNLAHMINYLQRGELPSDDKLARRITLTRDHFIIRDDKLLHLAVKRQKNNKTDLPITEQMCIPKHMQPTLLARYHSQLMHCGYEKLYLTMKQRVYWENLYVDVRNFVGQCEICLTSKCNNHPVKANIHCRDVPPQIFQRVHLDHVKISVKGATHPYTHALVIIDAMSLCCEIIPVKTTSAAETCQVLLREWIAKYGVFSELVTDRHASFTGKLTKLLTQSCGIRHLLISPYNSRSNGQAEKMNGIVLQGLRVICRGITDWHKMLAPIAAAYKAAVVPSRGASPFRLMYGVEMRLPVETALTASLPAHTRPTDDAELISKQLSVMRAHAQTLAQDSRQRAAKQANKRRKVYEFQPGDRVYKVRDALGESDDRKTASKFLGPYVILEKGTNDVYKLANFYSGRIIKNYVHVDKLKSCQQVRAAKQRTGSINAIKLQNRAYKRHKYQNRGVGYIATRPRATCGGRKSPTAPPQHATTPRQNPSCQQPIPGIRGTSPRPDSAIAEDAAPPSATAYAAPSSTSPDPLRPASCNSRQPKMSTTHTTTTVYAPAVNANARDSERNLGTPGPSWYENQDNRDDETIIWD